MTIREIINVLKVEGNVVSFYVRKDGGVRITKINGTSFTGSTGNVKAREMVGDTLSQARARQLSKLKTPTGKGSYNKRRKQKLDTETVKEIQRLQRKYRKDQTEGKPTIRNYRWVMQHKGKAEADRLLKQSDLYIRGLAYSENIDYLIGRLQSDADKLPSSEQKIVKRLIDKLNSMKGILREETLGKLLEEQGAIYRWEKGEIPIEEMYRSVIAELNKN